MKKFKPFVVLVLVLAFAMTTQSCLKDKVQISEAVEDVDVEEEDLTFSDDFEWKTTQSIELSVLPNANAVFYVKATDNRVYHKEYLKSGHAVTISVTIASYEKELVVELAGQRQKLDLSLGEYNVVYN